MRMKPEDYLTDLSTPSWALTTKYQSEFEERAKKADAWRRSVGLLPPKESK